MKKNILEFCLSPDLGGLELFMLNCFTHFKEETTCKVIVAPNSKLDNYLENEEKFHIKRNKLFPIIPALKLASFIDDNNIDVIHFHWTKDIATVVLARVISKKKPKVLQTRNMTMTRFKDDFYHKWLYKNIHTMHAVTHQVKAQIQKFIPQDICPKVEVVYMGTETKTINCDKLFSLREQYKLTDMDTFIVGIIGRIEEAKGQYLVIEAIEKLKDLNIKALIVGHTMDEEYLNGLKQKIKELNIEEKIIFTGFTKEVNEHMSLCNTTVLATPKETFGLVVIESMINGVPVIATNNGGPLEIIKDNIDGLLFNRTSVDLAQKLSQLYKDKELKEKLSLNAFNTANEKFNNEKQIDKLSTVIKGM